MNRALPLAVPGGIAAARIIAIAGYVEREMVERRGKRVGHKEHLHVVPGKDRHRVWGECRRLQLVHLRFGTLEGDVDELRVDPYPGMGGACGGFARLEVTECRAPVGLDPFAVTKLTVQRRRAGERTHIAQRRLRADGLCCRGMSRAQQGSDQDCQQPSTSWSKNLLRRARIHGVLTVWPDGLSGPDPVGSASVSCGPTIGGSV